MSICAHQPQEKREPVAAKVATGFFHIGVAQRRTSMDIHEQTFSIDGSAQAGWPYIANRFTDLSITDSPHIVIPPTVMIDSTLSITNGEVLCHLTIEDDQITASIFGTTIPHSLVPGMRGRTLSDLIEVPQLAGHPLMDKKIISIENMNPEDINEGEFGIDAVLEP